MVVVVGVVVHCVFAAYLLYTAGMVSQGRGLVDFRSNCRIRECLLLVLRIGGWSGRVQF